MSVHVNVDNFVRAESDRMFDFILQDTGGINRFLHNSAPTALDHQPIIRQNRDTIYSAAIVDVSQGAVLTLPEAGDRYLSAMIVSQDHYVPHIFHEAGAYTLTAEEVGSPYGLVAIRILVDPDDAADLASVHALQTQISIEAASAVEFALPDYDTVSFTSTREHLIALSLGLPDFRGAFGRRGEVNDVRHLLGAASGWGGFPESEAIYLNVDPKLPPGDYSLTVRDVPVNAFWSITVYNAEGYMQDNKRGIVSVNSITAEPDSDGSITVRFGEGDQPNTIPTPESWNYTVRLYQPRPELQSGQWSFPGLSAM